jgi:photosystem II stability/assembly factor-like uncharacterized protein
MEKLWGQDKRAYALAIVLLATVLLVAGCGTAPARSQSAAQLPAASGSSAASGQSAASGSSATSGQPAASGSSAASGPPTASGPQSTAPIWLDSLQMTSPSTGWALRWTQNPAVANGGYLAPARTVDGARTWTSVTPPAIRALLATPGATVVLQAFDGERAWLAVTAAATDGSPTHLTDVFATVNGGRTWTTSAPLKVSGYTVFLSFAGPEHGWLLMANGVAMGQEPVQLYRTGDAGLRWSLAARTPKAGTESTGLPAGCDKAALAFATASVGYISNACNLLSGALLVSRDGGVHWAPQTLPVPATSCGDGCQVSGPQFVGPTAFLVIDRAPEAPYFLVSPDLGVTWRSEPLPSGAGEDPRVQFFSPLSGMLVSAGPQGAIGHVFYTTADGGQTWTAVPQGRFFTQLGTSFDFVTARTGFAWAAGADAQGSSPPAMYQTTDSGRTWTAFTPQLAA